MIGLRIIAALAASLVVAGTPSWAAPAPEIAAGQEWSVKADPTSAIKVVIGRIEPWGAKMAVHVSLLNVPVPPCGSRPLTMTVGHMPFDRDALARSVDALLDSNVAPAKDFEAGYQQWKSARGGIFSISVSDAASLVAKQVAQTCPKP